MKLDRSLLRHLTLPAIIAALALACFLPQVQRSVAQNANQVILTPTGKELIQVIPQNTAAIAYTSISSLRDGRMWLYQVPLTGFTIVMTVDQSAVSLNPAGTLATGTITLPPTLVDGKMVSIFSTQIVTALTINTSNSATFAPAVVTALAANVPVAYVYDKANNQWHRIQ